MSYYMMMQGLSGLGFNDGIRPGGYIPHAYSTAPKYMQYRGMGTYIPHAYSTAPKYVSYSGLGELLFEDDKALWRVQAGGETISLIAQKVYGDATVWGKICSHNTSIGIAMDPRTPKGDCWYKPGTVIELPKIPGYPDPMATAPKSGLPTAPAGSTIVTPSGKVATVGTGGKLTSPTAAALSKAGMTPGVMIGLGVVAVAAIAGLALLAKKKPTSGPASRPVGAPAKATA